MGRSPEEGIKAPVKTTSLVNITLFGTGQTLNGVLTGTGDRVLVPNQTLASENGIYMVGPDAWERTTDLNAADDAANGQLVVDSNTLITYVLTYTGGAWSPGSGDINFTEVLGAMPASIVLTANDPIDLVDTMVALNVGASDPDTEQHIEVDFQSIQSKATATAFAGLNLNPLGGIVDIGQQTGADDTEVRIWHNGHHSWDFQEAYIQAYSYQAFDNTVPDNFEWVLEIYDTPSGNLWGSFGWNGEDALRIKSLGYDSDFILNMLNSAGTEFDGVILNSGNFAVNLDVGGAQDTMFDTSSGATLAASIFAVYVPATFDFSLDVTGTLSEGGVPVALSTDPPNAHTHVAADVTDFQAAVSANASVAANTAKVSNVSTALSIGTHAIGTLGITSDGGANDVVLPSFTNTLSGLAPGSGGGTTNFLRADGTWAAPPGGSGGGLTVVTETTTSRTAVNGEAIMVDDDTAGSTVTITLPAGAADDQILVNKRGSTANVIIDGDASETINGLTTQTLTTQYESVWLIWDGTEWSIN